MRGSQVVASVSGSEELQSFVLLSARAELTRVSKDSSVTYAAMVV